MTLLPMTAAEARAYTDERKPSAIRKEYENLRLLMSDRIADGKYNISISPDKLFFAENKERLLHDGFSLNDYIETGRIIISW